MFSIGEVVGVVGGQLIRGNPYSKVSGVSIDSRTIKNNQLFIAIKGNRFDGHNFIREAIHNGAKGIIINDSRYQVRDNGKASYIKVADTRRALADLARFHRQRFDIPIIAITGSNGKTTTKDMAAWVLSSQAKVLKNLGTQNNDIGVPLTLLRLDSSHNICVLELGTNHFGEIAYLVNIAQPNFGVITNIAPAHLEYFKTLSGVYKEKISLLGGLMPPKIAILNADDKRSRNIKNSKNNFTVTYGIKNKCDFRATGIQFNPTHVEFRMNPLSYCHSKFRLNTIGPVNVYNALASIAVARLLGYSYAEIRHRLATFKFIPGRLSLIKLNRISFIDDTYNANPASLSEALDVMSKFNIKGRKIFIMGDMLELGRQAGKLHHQAGMRIASVCNVFISVGELAGIAGRWAVKYGLKKSRVFNCRDSEGAGSVLFKVLKPDYRDLILVKGSRLMQMERVFKKK